MARWRLVAVVTAVCCGVGGLTAVGRAAEVALPAGRDVSEMATLESLTERVELAATLAGHPVARPAVSSSLDPVAVLTEAALVSEGLRRRAVAAMDPGAWELVDDGVRATIGLMSLEAGGSDQASRLIVDPDRMATVERGLAVLRVDAGLMWQASATLAAGVDRAIELIDAGAPLRAGVSSTPLGDVVIDTGPAPCDDVYTAPALVVVDLCGDDTYAAPAGGADGLGVQPIAIVIDRAGHDAALPAGDGTGTPALGAAVNGGIAITVDEVGDDVRSPGVFSADDLMGSHGGLISGAGRAAGYGFLFDGAGNDDYRVQGFEEPAKLGAGHFAGVGVLVDGAGDDIYGGDTFEEGSGWFGDAFGLLVDLAGDDRYYDFSTYSLGSGGVGGTGLLYDASGADSYAGDSFLQLGAGGCNGVGVLRDGGGADYYRGALFGMGFGTSDPIGCFDEFGDGLSDRLLRLLPAGAGSLVPRGIGRPIDELAASSYGVLADEGAGDDLFEGSYLVQGAHLAGGAGYLLDAGGDDRYLADACAQAIGDVLGVSGCGWGMPGAGSAELHDEAGDDTYSLGWCEGQGVGYGSTVALVDGGGLDTYTCGVVNGGGVQPRGTTGMAVDHD